MSPRSTVGMFSYADLVVVCGEPEFHDAVTDIILNPTAIAEVLSPSTESFDRGEKFERYKKWNPTLKDYLLVSQDESRVEHHSWQADDTWPVQIYKDLKASFIIASIGSTLQLEEIHDRMVFPKGAPGLDLA